MIPTSIPTVLRDLLERRGCVPPRWTSEHRPLAQSEDRRQTVDYNEQAAKSAKDYLDFSSFSRSGLIEQLEFEGYTSEQAEYGVSQTGL